MGCAVSVFVAGLGGVFAGMGLLYVSIRITALITKRLTSGEDRND